MTPALFFGLNLLLGSAFALHPHWIYLPALFLLWFKRPLQKVAVGALLLLSAYGYTLYRIPPPLPEGIQTGILSIDCVQPFSSPFHHSLLYRAKFNQIPCTLFFSVEKERPLAICNYFVEGELVAKDHGPPTFKPKRKFVPLQENRGIVEWRFQQKERLRQYLYRKISDHRAAHFLSALLTGDVDDRQLSLEFRKVGLSHLLAISGLDFALLAAFLGWLLRLFLPMRASDALLLLLMCGYFFFLGVSPSILRAFTAIALFLVARLFNFQARALNLLGAALIVELLYDPLTIQHPGFQLTFLCTIGLLFFFRPFDQFLCRFLPKRPLHLVSALPFFDQHIALLSGLIRQSLAATLAAHLLALPVCLYQFHSFPAISLLYNLFFPFGSGIALLLAFLGLALGPLGSFIHILNSAYTGFLLRLIASPPPLLEYSFYVARFPFALLIALLTALIWLGIDRKPSLEA